MRVLRQGHRGIIPIGHCNFLIYEETESDVSPPTPPPVMILNLGEESTRRFKELQEEGLRSIYRAAYGHPIRCFFVVYKDGNITYEFDNERQYSQEELKKMIRLANRAKRRCRFSFEMQKTFLVG